MKILHISEIRVANFRKFHELVERVRRWYVESFDNIQRGFIGYILIVKRNVKRDVKSDIWIEFLLPWGIFRRSNDNLDNEFYRCK